MSYGLQLWNVNGELSLDISSRIAKWVGEYSGIIDARTTNDINVEFKNRSIDIAIPGMQANGEWIVLISSVSTYYNGYLTPTLSPAIGQIPYTVIGSGKVTVNWGGFSKAAWVRYDILTFKLLVYKF